MKHIKLQSKKFRVDVKKALDLELDPCSGLAGLELLKCRKENAFS